MADNYIKKINGLPVAASEAAPGSPLAETLATLATGSFEVVSLTMSGKPDVTTPEKKIYLTKAASATLTDPYTEWIYTGTFGETVDPTKWEIIGETSIDLSGYKTKQTAISVSGLGTLKTITSLSQNANGEISGTASDIQSASTSQKGVVQLAGSIGDTVSSENNKAASEKAVRDAINALDVPATGTGAITGFGAGKTLATLTETNGKVAATFQDISITKSQVSDFPTEMTPSSHTHGNITNVGGITATGVDIASGDSLVIVDSSDTNKKLAKTSITFDGSTTTKFLSQKGTWESTPAANDGALKLQINGGTTTSKFTANQSSDSTITFATGTTNGTIKVDGTEVAVAGLGSAAYTASTAYATSAQGTKADTAIQDVTVNGASVKSGTTAVIPLANNTTSGSAGTAGVVTLEIVSI